MKVKVENWSISDLYKKKDNINNQPEYQRGEVWSPQKRKLLIDSILRGIDLPKIYLRKLSGGPFKYEIADGQQRVSTLYKFFEDNLKLDHKTHNGLDLTKIGHESVFGLVYSKLPTKLKNAFDNYPLTIAIVEKSDGAEIRTLFGRLQLGSQLNPAEKRNAIISLIGDHVNNFALNHQFFVTSRIPNSRYKHQDYLAHGLALMLYNNRKDLKGELLEELYLDSSITINQATVQTIDETLDCMFELNKSLKGRLINKFAFIDFFWFLCCEFKQDKNVDYDGISQEFLDFELLRLKNNSNPEVLIENSNPSAYDKDLYIYINAFRYNGSSPVSIASRHRVFKNLFTKYIS